MWYAPTINLGCYLFYGTQHKIGFRGIAIVDLRCCKMFFWMLQ
jgi:hypothetical protein